MTQLLLPVLFLLAAAVPAQVDEVDFWVHHDLLQVGSEQTIYIINPAAAGAQNLLVTVRETVGNNPKTYNLYVDLDEFGFGWTTFTATRRGRHYVKYGAFETYWVSHL